ncbi:MAG: M50 family metallopeptidase, partial [Bradymonadaceae bacterium]
MRNGFGFGMTIGLGVAAFVIGRYAAEIVEIALAQFIGIRFCLESLSDVDYMFTKQFRRGGRVMSSDTQAIAEQLGGVYWFWGA